MNAMLQTSSSPSSVNSLLRSRHSALSAAVMLVLGLIPASPNAAPSAQHAEFSTAFLGGDMGANELARFARGGSMLPGQYPVDVFVNEYLVSRKDVLFKEVDGNVVPCMTEELMSIMGVDAAKTGTHVLGKAGECRRLEGLIPDATVRADASQLRLNVSIPQAAMVHRSAGEVDRALWARGMTAFTLGYAFNAAKETRPSLNHGGSANLGVQAGLNVGGWRIRNRSHIGWNGRSGSSAQNIATYAQHDVEWLTSQLTIGDAFTEGRLFDAVGFRGVHLATDDRMRPDSHNGFAPIIRGVAQTQARVIVRQAGYIVYTMAVAPGAFEITDLGASGYRGDLDVTVEESDGQERTFIVPFAAVPNLLRPGASRYSVTGGVARSSLLAGEGPVFLEGTYQRGFNNLISAYVGAQMGGKRLYSSALVGTAINTPVGAMALDLTAARVRFTGRDESLHGYSARVTYSRSIPATNTDFALAAYRYTSKGYFDLPTAIRLDDVVREGGLAGGVDEAANGQRSRVQLTLSQRLGARWGQLHFSGSRHGFWSGRSAYTGYDLSWMHHYRDVSFGLSVNRARDGIGAFSNSVNASIMLPLGPVGARGERASLALQSGHARGTHTLNASISDSVGRDEQLSYGVNGSISGTRGDSVGVNGRWRSPYAELGASITQGHGRQRGSVSATGGVVAHRGGLTFANGLGETIGIVQAAGAHGARVSGNYSRVDRRGYAIAPSLMPYRVNDVSLDTKSTSLDVDFKTTKLLTVPRAGAVVPLTYKTSVGKAFVLQGVLTDGSPLPFGAEVKTDGGALAGYVGQGGNVLVRIPATGTTQLFVSLDASRRCRLDWSPAPALESATAISSVRCGVAQNTSHD